MVIPTKLIVRHIQNFRVTLELKVINEHVDRLVCLKVYGNTSMAPFYNGEQLL